MWTVWQRHESDRNIYQSLDRADGWQRALDMEYREESGINMIKHIRRKSSTRDNKRGWENGW